MTFRRPSSPSSTSLSPLNLSTHRGAPSSRSHSRSPSPPSPSVDHYAPRPQGLPLYSATRANSEGGMEVVDSSTARRRGASNPAMGPLLQDGDSSNSNSNSMDELEQDESKGGKRLNEWPQSGIGMEGRIPETRKEYLKATSGGIKPTKGTNKWDKLIKEPSKVTWVSQNSLSLS